MALFSREHGLIRGVAKGSKREKSKFSGGFEPPSRGVVAFSPKPTEGLTLLTSWDLIETYPVMRLNLRAFHAGMAMIDLIYHAVVQNDPHPGLFDALSESLSSIREPALVERALLSLLFAALDETGHRPELSADVRTGETLVVANAYGFSARLGGLVADDVGVRVDREGGEIWRVRAATVDLLRQLGDSNIIGDADSDTIKRATRLLALYYREVFRIEPLILKHIAEDGGRT